MLRAVVKFHPRNSVLKLGDAERWDAHVGIRASYIPRKVREREFQGALCLRGTASCM
jgi:hypothetical protein